MAGGEGWVATYKIERVNMKNAWDEVVGFLQKIRALARQSGIEDEVKSLIVSHAESALTALEAPHEAPTNLEGKAALDGGANG